MTHGRKEVPQSHNAALIAVDALIAAMWVSICAATPEFIWRGAWVIVDRAQWGDLVSALLIGLILAFCIEPAMERLRHVLRHGTDASSSGEDRSYNLLFPTLAGLAFALSSVCIHDAITAFVASGTEGHATPDIGFDVGLQAAIHIADAWAIVPFCICLAWLSSGEILLKVPLGILAALSPVLAAWWFSWPLEVLITTELPCLAILFAGYRQWRKGPIRLFYRRCAVSLGWIAIIWLVGAALLDRVMTFLDVGWNDLYTWPDFGVDARFYFGWLVGLLLAPVPLVEMLRSSSTVGARDNPSSPSDAIE